MRNFNFKTVFCVCVFLFCGCAALVAEDSVERKAYAPPSLVSVMPAADQWTEIKDLDKKADVLDLIYNCAQSNYEKIKTWEAKYKLNIHTAFKTIKAFKSDCEVTFSLDVKKDVMNWKVAAENFCEYESNQWVDIPNGGVSMQRIHHLNQTLELHELRAQKNALMQEIPKYIINSRIAYDKPGFYMPSPASQMSDPRYFYSSRRSKVWETYWKSYPIVASMLRGADEKKKQRFDDLYMVLECTSGNEILYKVEEWFPGRKCRQQETYYAGNASFNPVECVAKDCYGYVIMHKLWDWQEQEGVYIPQKYSCNYGNELSLNEYELIESEINRPISADTFTYKGLAIGEGDLLFDEVEKMVYKLDKKRNKQPFCPYGGEIIKTREFKLPSLPRMIFILLGLLLLIIGIVGKIRKRYLMHKQKNT